MPKTKIEWVRNEDGSPGYTLNPIKGLCPVGCSYCYARRLYQRFKWDPTVQFDPLWALRFLERMHKPSRIFVGSTMELFGPWVKPEWMALIMDSISLLPEHTFIFLTKKPENLPREWPDNCWVGVTATNQAMLDRAVLPFARVRAKVKFLSFEPLLGPIDLSRYRCDLQTNLDLSLIIIGQQTPVRKKTTPSVEAIREIVSAADNAGIPMFLKNNLDCLLGQDLRFVRSYGKDSEGNTLHRLRQEFPEVKVDAQ